MQGYHTDFSDRAGARWPLPQRLALGLVLSSGVAVIAYRRKLLTRSGMAGTMLVGTLVFAFEGLAGSSVVLFFFGSSSFLSRLSSERKRRVAADKFSKSGSRDLAQTLANGGVGALAALGHELHPRRPAWLFGAFVGAFATATADTWATELGTLSRAAPRLITSGRKVPPGTSGAITVAGTVGATAGALALSIAAMLATRSGRHLAPRLDTVVGGLCGGIAGALVDSLLGATVQHLRWCPRCRSETEQQIHQCGIVTVSLRGVAWMDNDMVNLVSTAAGAGVAAGVAAIVGRIARSRSTATSARTR